MEAPLNRRARQILQAIVGTYIETGEPVGSRTVAKGRKDNLSPASIRNVMADLADDGFLSQPHTSAGRVPTEKAFRYYVKSLAAGRLPSAEALRLRAELADLPSVEAYLERSSHILTEMTRSVGIAAAIPRLGQVLDQIELISLGNRRVLMIMVTRDRLVRELVVALEETISPEELTSIRNYVNRNFSGWQLGEARRELLRRAVEDRAAYDEMTRKLSLLYAKGLLDADRSPEIHMEGASNLVGLDLHLTSEKLRDLLHALEEKKRLIELLDRFLEQPGGELEVHVGLEEAHPSMKELSLIGISLSMPNGLSAKVAVLGPMRMDYEKVMGVVQHMGRMLENVQF